MAQSLKHLSVGMSEFVEKCGRKIVQEEGADINEQWVSKQGDEYIGIWEEIGVLSGLMCSS